MLKNFKKYVLLAIFGVVLTVPNRARGLNNLDFKRLSALQKLTTRAHEHWDLDWRDENNSTALDLAAQDGFCDVMRLLLNGGANVNAANSDGQTAFHRGVEYAPVECLYQVVRMFLEYGADPNAKKTSSGTTPFFLAVQQKKLEVVKLFFNPEISKIKPDITVKPSGYYNRSVLAALLVPSWGEVEQIFTFLVDQGANTTESVVDCEGKVYTLIELAEERDNKLIARYLRKKELDASIYKNVPVDELEKQVRAIRKLERSFLKVFSSLRYFQANLKNLPKKPTGLFDKKTGTFMTPGAAELLGVKSLSTDKKKKADEPDIIICFKKWYESSANPKKHKRDGRASQKNVKKRKKNVGAMVPLVAGLTLGGK